MFSDSAWILLAFFFVDSTTSILPEQHMEYSSEEACIEAGNRLTRGWRNAEGNEVGTPQVRWNCFKVQ